MQFVEVKGPGDRLSDTQVVWLETLTDLGVHAEVCHVQGRWGRPSEGKGKRETGSKAGGRVRARSVGPAEGVKGKRDPRRARRVGGYAKGRMLEK